MTCGICNKTDGRCYTSNPPQVKCTITGEFHYYDDNCTCQENDAVMNDKLKPCPFCGGEANMGKALDGLYIVNCTKCFATSALSKSKELVARHWNRRVTDGTERKAD